MGNVCDFSGRGRQFLCVKRVIVDQPWKNTQSVMDWVFFPVLDFLGSTPKSVLDSLKSRQSVVGGRGKGCACHFVTLHREVTAYLLLNQNQDLIRVCTLKHKVSLPWFHCNPLIIRLTITSRITRSIITN
jgi:hypothetical protein